ncbi:MAG: adenylate/guanylate cyclase domain-containing protein [Alphaproteobacteria bacterium]
MALTVGFGLLLLIAVGSVGWFLLDAGRQNTFDLLRQKSEITLDSIEAQLDQHLSAAARQAEYLAARVAQGAVEPTDPERMVDMMFGALAATPQVNGIAFIDTELEALRVGRKEGLLVWLRSDWSEREDISAMIEMTRDAGPHTWLGIAWLEDFQEPHVAIVAPAHRNGVYLGSFSSVVSLRALSGFLDKLDRDFGTRSFILHGRDHVLAHSSLIGGAEGLSEWNRMPRLDEIGVPVLGDIWAPGFPLRILEDSTVQGRAVKGSDGEQIYIFREINDYGGMPWTLGVYFLGREVNAELRRLGFALAAAGVVLTLSLIAVFFFGRAIARPIVRLAERTRAIRELDLSNARPMGRSLFRETDDASAAYDAMLSSLRWFETYVPKSLVLRLMRLGEDAVRSEQRAVTVMFTDIADFSGLSERYPPAELVALLNQHFALLLDDIEAEDGTVDKFIGDSVMAFWGAPEARLDHAEATCRAALAIRASIAAENRRRRNQGAESLDLRIGIHSGVAVVGNIGAAGRLNYTLIGDTVNVAQRLEALGKELDTRERETTILLSGDTAALLGARFEVRPLGDHRLRGRRTATEVFELLGESETGDPG